MKQENIAQLMQASGVKFGTSGARGLVSDMTDRVCFAYTLAFLNHLESSGDIQRGMKVAVAGDYRPSTPRIMQAVAQAIAYAGFKPVSCGFVPTPAVAAYAMKRGIASMMVTGSHIPDDRNGIKFYKPAGEILKNDELGMCAREVDIPEDGFDEAGKVTREFAWEEETQDAYVEFVRRYVDFFPAHCLKGKRIGVYEHSSVARDVLAEVMEGLGAEVMRLGYSESFIPVDTEAVRPEDDVLAKQWSEKYQFDCIVSADGDGDRPLVSDERGNWLRGDVLGIVCAQYLQATSVATPVSCNSAVEKSGLFKQVNRTKIGSPFVIAAMQQAMDDGDVCVVGYEANGGFLTAADITLQDKVLSALPTRDALIVPLALLMASINKQKTISALLQTLPQRFTSSGRIQNLPTAISVQHIADISVDASGVEALFGAIKLTDKTDGFRITFTSEEVVHLRPSGNAPELRCYVEADTQQRADAMLAMALDYLARWKHSAASD